MHCLLSGHPEYMEAVRSEGEPGRAGVQGPDTLMTDAPPAERPTLKQMEAAVNTLLTAVVPPEMHEVSRRPARLLPGLPGHPGVCLLVSIKALLRGRCSEFPMWFMGPV